MKKLAIIIAVLAALTLAQKPALASETAGGSAVLKSELFNIESADPRTDQLNFYLKRTKYFTYIVITSIFLAVLILLTSGTASTLWMYILTNLGLAVALAMQDPITTSYVTNHMDERKLGLGSGILSTVGIFFTALGQISIPGLADLLGFKWLHLISGFFWLLLIAVILFVNYQINQKEKRNGLSS